MSRRTFIRRFTAATGLSPGEWVLEARVKEAQILLETSDRSVEQVATAAGFGSSDALRHHFRTRLHTSPQRYRSTFRGMRRTADPAVDVIGGKLDEKTASPHVGSRVYLGNMPDVRGADAHSFFYPARRD
jgi:hypothetical protein